MVDRQSRAFKGAVTLEHRSLGVAFLGLLAFGVWFACAVFNKTFTDYDEATPRASKLGLQLPDQADMEVRGVLVGELRTMQPAEVNHTLTAMATTLEARGEAMGADLVTFNDYLGRTHPQIPALAMHLRMLSEVSDTYRAVMPEVARLLRNGVSTGHTFIEKEQKIQALYADVGSFSSTWRDFLETNGDAVVDTVAAPVLGVPTASVSDLAALLLGPLARGTEVELR